MKKTVLITHCSCKEDSNTLQMNNVGECEWCHYIGDYTEEHDMSCDCQYCKRHERALAKQALEIFDLDTPVKYDTDLPF